MKAILKNILLFTAISSSAFAYEVEDLSNDIRAVQVEWEAAKYQTKSEKDKIGGYEKCAATAENFLNAYDNAPEFMIWEGICLASQAELLKLSALSKAKAARELFENAASINDRALDGSAYTNLGVLYHRVPGWPIGFGDHKKAEEYFQKVLEIAPDNIDANYFYAEFLIDEEQYDKALSYLNKALDAPSRNRPLADSERKKEVREAIKKAEHELAEEKKKWF